jgi:hypothetical protein
MIPAASALLRRELPAGYADWARVKQILEKSYTHSADQVSARMLAGSLCASSVQGIPLFSKIRIILVLCPHLLCPHLLCWHRSARFRFAPFCFRPRPPPVAAVSLLCLAAAEVPPQRLGEALTLGGFARIGSDGVPLALMFA